MIFDPKRNDFLVLITEGVFQIVQSRNQSGRQCGRTLVVNKELAERLVQGRPVNLVGEH